MTSEAVTVDVDPGAASPELVALVAKRELELSGKAATSTSAASKTNGKAAAVAVASVGGQAEEVEAGRDDAKGAPDEGKPDDAKKPLDVEWAKSDALKRRITDLHEAGHLDDDLIGLIRTGVERKAHLRAANDKFEAAAEKVKAANTERDQFRERAERYDRLMADPKFHKALHAAESGDTEDDESLMTAEEKRIARLEKRVADREAKESEAEKSASSATARVKEIEGWANDHKESLGESVSTEEYEAAFAEMLRDIIEEKEDPRNVLTSLKVSRRTNVILARNREEKEVAALRGRVDDSKRDVVRSARASSPAGVRTEVGKTFATPKAARIAASLEKYPLRPE